MPGKHVIAIIGPKSAGKTQLHTRLIGKKEFSEAYTLKTGVQIGQNEAYPTVQYWDFGPDIDTASINSYLSKAHKICLVFDANDVTWMQTLANYLYTNTIIIPELTPVLFVGTRGDTLSEQASSTLHDLTRQYAQKMFNGAAYIQVSSKTDENIDALSHAIVSNLPILEEGFMSPNSALVNASVLKALQTMLREGTAFDPEAFFDTLVNASEEELQDPAVQQLIPVVSSPLRPVSPKTTEPVTPSSAVSRKLVNEFATNPGNSPEKSSTMPASQPPRPHDAPSDTCCSFALRLVGMALMLAALVSLIYLVLIAASVVSALAFTTLANSIVITVGGLLGASAPLAAFSGTCASLGLSTTAASSVLAAGVSLVTMGLGYGVFRSGKQPTIENTEPTSSCCFA